MPAISRRFFTGSGAHESGRRNDPGAAEIEAVGVPAAADRGVVGVIPIGVPDAGKGERIKSAIFHIEETASLCQGKVSPPFAVVRVVVVVHPPGIVKPREEANDKKITA